MAMNMVGRCYENGWGVAPDMLLATYWFRLAALEGLDWGMYNYATSLALGRGVDTDRHAALSWLRKAAELGHAKSWNLIGGFHEDGWEVEADMDIALECYRKAAEGGDFRGQFNYARLLARKGEMFEAADWMKSAYENANEAFREKMRDFLGGSEGWSSGVELRSGQ
jgi:TPR repeat protein